MVDLTRYRHLAVRAWAHPLSKPVRALCDEVELLRMQLSALVADNHRLRAQVRDLLLADDPRRNSRNVADQLRRD